MNRDYLTKVWLGRWWTYIFTDHSYHYRTHRLFGRWGWHWGIISYKIVREDLW